MSLTGRRCLEFSLSHVADMHYFKREWSETRGDSYNNWGTSIWYFEAEPDLCVTRQVEVYVNGQILRYDRQHLKDEYGGLAEKPLDADDFLPFTIERSEFEQAWNSHKPFNI